MDARCVGRVRRLCVPLLVCAFGCAWPAAARQAAPRQAPATSQRQDRVIPTNGTAHIRGRVITADSGQPLYRATIALRSPAGRLSVLTDVSGRYEFRNLPAGRYTVSAGKPGFVTVQFGGRRFAEAGTPVALAAGQTRDGINVALPRGAVIAGRVADEFGEAAIDTVVQVSRVAYGQGRPRLVTVGRSGRTDDLGQFRIFNLRPGSYYVSAVSREPSDEARIASEASSGYAPTYYPGTPDLAGAQRVIVGAGEQMLSVSFSLVPARLARVAGVVLDSSGNRFPGAALTLIRREEGVPIPAALSASTREDGTFSIANVAPGSYVLQARGRAIATGVPEFATAPVAVSGADLPDLTLATSTGAKIDGAVVFEGAPPRIAASAVQVTAHAADLPAGRLVESGATSRVNSDWTFQLTGLFGRRLIRVSGLPSSWSLQRVLVDGSDVTDAGVDLGGDRAARRLEVLVTDRVAEVAGTVTGERGVVAESAVVVVFASDSARWGPLTRFVAGERTAAGGHFTVAGLPPAEYLAVAVPDLVPGAWFDPEFLAWARPYGTAFSLGPGERKVLVLGLVEH